MKNKKKAFTLTELLIVVIVIGVLSAVVLPKFNKVMETRKTTEAEEVMAAIRTEQEQRCSLNKVYTKDFTSFIENNDIKLASVPGDTSKAESNNFTYTLTGRRIKATSKDRGYTLQMPSIADGRISCDGDYCSKLNKDYPTRTELEAKADYMAVSPECGPTDSCDDDALAGNTESCECTGTRPRSCDTSTGTWTWGECEGGSTAQTRSNVSFTPQNMGPTGCGKRTEKQVCSNGAWTWTNAEIIGQPDTSGCQPLCTPGSIKNISGSCGCKGLGTKYLKCGNDGLWGTTEFCTRESPCECTGDETTSEGCNANGTRTRYCNTTTGQWTGSYSECTYTYECEGTKEPTSCTNDLYTAGVQNWRCDTTTGTWVADGGCVRAPNACEWSALGNTGFCWKCGDPPVQGRLDEIPDKPGLGISSVDGKIFSFYYADACIETCTTAGRTTPPSIDGCQNAVQVGPRARCVNGSWVDKNRACSELYGSQQDQNTMLASGVSRYCTCYVHRP